MVREEYMKLRDHLYVLDSLVNMSRRVSQFRSLDAAGWTIETFQAKQEELDDACTKCELMTKMCKNILSSFKKGTGGKNPLA